MAENKSTGAGKGDKLRPVNKKVYDANFDAIDWNPKPKKEFIGGKRITREQALKDLLNLEAGVTDIGGVCYDGSRSPRRNKKSPKSVIDPGGVVYDGSRGLEIQLESIPVIHPGGVAFDGASPNFKYDANLDTSPDGKELVWDDGDFVESSVIDPGGPVCDGASKFLDQIRNKS